MGRKVPKPVRSWVRMSLGTGPILADGKQIQCTEFEDGLLIFSTLQSPVWSYSLTTHSHCHISIFLFLQ